MDSKNWMSHNKGDVGTMYLKHIKEVLGFLTAQYWGLRVLMWDDMLRKISVGALQGEGTGTALVAPVPGSSAPPTQCPAWQGSPPVPAGTYPVGTWLLGKHGGLPAAAVTNVPSLLSLQSLG